MHTWASAAPGLGALDVIVARVLGWRERKKVEAGAVRQHLIAESLPPLPARMSTIHRPIVVLTRTFRGVATVSTSKGPNSCGPLQVYAPSEVCGARNAVLATSLQRAISENTGGTSSHVPHPVVG
jgi:hypothetical protein